MASSTTSDIVFLEVDADDVATVQRKYPEARCVTEIVNGDALVQACQDATAVSTFLNTRFTPEVLAQLPQLKLIVTRTVGFDHIHLETCKQRGIVVANVPDYGSHVISEHVFALLLSTLRHIHTGSQRMQGGRMDYQGLRGIALRNKTIGIMGTGKIGRGVAQIARGFGMRILAVDLFRVPELETELGGRYVELPELLAQSDFISMHLPSNRDTYHCLNDAAFAQMKDGVTIVNTARGDLIDSAALLRALNSGKVAHALLDVLENERSYADNRELISHPKVVTTPHIAFYADDSVGKMYTECFDSIDQFRAGEPVRHEVKPVVKVPGGAGVKA